MTSRAQVIEKTGGFVLVEALVALILISLILSLFALTLTFGRKVADAGRVRDRMTEIATGTAVLSGWLARARPIVQPRAEGQPRILFDGSASRLSFTTLSNGDTQPGGILAVTINFEESGAQNTGTMVFDTSLIPAGTTSLPVPETGEILMRYVASAKFSYFGSLQEGDPARWHDEWRDAPRLPRVIALRTNVRLNQRLETFDTTFRIVSE